MYQLWSAHNISMFDFLFILALFYISVFCGVNILRKIHIYMQLKSKGIIKKGGEILVGYFN